MSPAVEQELELARLSSELKRKSAQRSLATKTLEVLLVTKFVYEYGFQNGRLVAERIVEDILETIQNYWVPASDVQEPGSFTALAVSKEAVPGPYPLRLEETPHVPVQLRLTTEDERYRLTKGKLRLSDLRRERAIRFFFEAEKQGGLLTLTDVGWFVGASTGAVGSWVRAHQAATGEIVPTRGTLHDIGRGTTHKRMIVRLYLNGKLPSEIARATSHALKNVDRYIGGFERVRLLAREHPADEIPALAGMSSSLVREYLTLIEDFTHEQPSAASQGVRSPQPPSHPAPSEISAPAPSQPPADL
jgi:hypothetical protein